MAPTTATTGNNGNCNSSSDRCNNGNKCNEDRLIPLNDYLAQTKAAQQQQQKLSNSPSTTASTVMSCSSSTVGSGQSGTGAVADNSPTNNNHLPSAAAGTRQQGPSYLYKDDPDAIAKIATLESIDRLARHVPHIVLDQLLTAMKEEQKAAREEERARQEEGGLAGFMIGSRSGAPMTLEVPIGDLAASSNHSHISIGDDSGSSSNKKHNNSNMNDLVNTLESLDELLNEEFSSDTDDSDSNSDGDDPSSSEDDEDNENGKHDNNTMDVPGNSRGDDDDSISEVGEHDVLDDGHDSDDDDHYGDEEDDGESTSDNSYSDFAEFQLPPSRPCSRRGSECGSMNSGARYGLPGNNDHAAGCRGRSPLPKNDNSRHRALSPLPSNSGHSSRHSSRSPLPGYRTGSPLPAGMEEVGKLKQGRLVARRQETDSMPDERSTAHSNNDQSTVTHNTRQDGTISTEVLQTQQTSAILFVDISGFTKLSRSLEVEHLSKVINSYFQRIVNEIKAYGGDILKFAGDALIVEWTAKQMPEGQQHQPLALLAALCASKLVDKCSDYPVKNSQGEHFATLNLHCAVGYGSIVGAHVGDMDRQEYLILGDCLKQIADAMDYAQLGEVVASPEAVKELLETVQFKDAVEDRTHQTLAFKGDKKFQPKSSLALPDFTRPPVSSLCHEWSLSELENLQRKMSRYVHSVVYSDEFAAEERNSKKSTQAELRDVFTVFIQPKLKYDLNAGENAGDDEMLQLLNTIMFIVNSEVSHFKAHLRQFIVDDKGLVVIANFGLRGSTFPNMIEERAIPCITNIRTLLKTELDLDCRMGATIGKAYCGVVGGKTRHEYAILGPSVNLAARLMANASNPGILVDQQVKSKAGERLFKALPPVKAKGYDDLVKIYNPAESVRKAWKNVTGEFVGREEEVDILESWAQTVRNESFTSKTIFISGPYGIGKSYLLSQAAQKIEDEVKNYDESYHVSRYVFCDEDSFRPFSIVRPLFLDLLRRKQHVPSFGSAEKAGHNENLDQTTELEEAQLYVSLLQVCLEAKIPMHYIEMFGGLIFSTKLADIGTWSDRSARMDEWNEIARNLVTAFIHCTAEYKLVLLALDDVSGMDEMSWKILQKLYIRAGNLMVVATARNEFDLNINQEFWSDLNEDGIEEGRFKHLRMSPMNEKEIGQLACKRLAESSTEIDETVGRTVLNQSRGNPLLACEILDVMYKDDGDVDPDLADARETKIEELLLNRLDELLPVVRSHLNLGAILGSTFEEKDIVSVMEKYNDIPDQKKEAHAASVHASLQDSVQYGILKCEPAGKTYTFSHALWRKTIGLHILDEWKDEMRALIEDIEADVMMDVSSSGRGALHEFASSCSVGMDIDFSHHSEEKSFEGSTSDGKILAHASTDVAKVENGSLVKDSNTERKPSADVAETSCNGLVEDQSNEEDNQAVMVNKVDELIRGESVKVDSAREVAYVNEGISASFVNDETGLLDVASGESNPLVDAPVDKETLFQDNSDDADVGVKFDWDEFENIKAGLFKMRHDSTAIQQSVNELRALINNAR